MGISTGAFIGSAKERIKSYFKGLENTPPDMVNQLTGILNNVLVEGNESDIVIFPFNDIVDTGGSIILCQEKNCTGKNILSVDKKSGIVYKILSSYLLCII
jgi:hypothetical protein